MEWDERTKKFFYLHRMQGYRIDQLPPGSIKAAPAKKKTGVVKKAPKPPKTRAQLNAEGSEKARRNCVRFAAKLDDFRNKFNIWLYPKSQHKSLVAKISMKNNPDKVCGRTVLFVHFRITQSLSISRRRRW